MTQVMFTTQCNYESQLLISGIYCTTWPAFPASFVTVYFETDFCFFPNILWFKIILIRLLCAAYEGVDDAVLLQGGSGKGDMRVPAASVYRSGGVGGVVGCVTAPTTPATHPHLVDHDEEQISRLAHHLSQISGDQDGLQVTSIRAPLVPLLLSSL